MENFETVLDDLKDIFSGIENLKNTAYQQYSALVDAIIHDQIADEKKIEQIMDGLLDFGDEVRFIDIYRKLCRHIYYHYPQMVGEHVALFRVQFETAEDYDWQAEESPPVESPDPTKITDEQIEVIAIEAAKRHGCSEEHVRDMEAEVARQKYCDSDHSPDYRTY